MSDRRRKLGDENSALIHQVNAGIPGQIATHAATPHGQEYERDIINLTPNDSAYFNGGQVKLNAVGEYMMGHFRAHEFVDADNDIIFSFVWDGEHIDDIACKKYIGANAVGSEVYNHNIHNGTAFDLSEDGVNRLQLEEFTIANADFDTNDKIHVGIMLNEAARTINFFSIEVRYKFA